MADERLLCRGRILLGAEASGPLVALQEPVSFWGGVDDETGRIVDVHHPQLGVGLAGSALLMGATRGSSSSSSTLLECIRRDTAPALLLLTDTDPIVVVAVAAAWEIYGRGPSVVMLPETPDITGVESVRLDATGRVFARDL